MDQKTIVTSFWKDMSNQNFDKLIQYISKDAIITWHNTNEVFNPKEYIFVNRTYPGNWEIDIMRLEEVNSIVITVEKIYTLKSNVSFHGTSFFEFKDDLIVKLDEYFGEDEKPPKWRQDLNAGTNSQQ